MLDDRLCGERGAVSADADKAVRQHGSGPLREVDDLRDIGEIVAGKGDEVGPPFRDHTMVVGVALDLQVENSRLVSNAAGRFGHELEA
jgi:hypothetical protein